MKKRLPLLLLPALINEITLKKRDGAKRKMR